MTSSSLGVYHRAMVANLCRCRAGGAARAEVCRLRAVARDSSGRDAWRQAAVGLLAGLVVLGGAGPACAKRAMEGVNKPELLPKEPNVTVIDIAGFLTDGEEARLTREIAAIEQDTGVKLRVLAQNYPDTPGLAIKDYWGVDGDTVVMVADPNTGNLLNFNVGDNVDLEVPRNFWSRLAGKYGIRYYWREKGEAAAILNGVSAIDTCLREPQGRAKCVTVQGEFGEM